VDLSQTILVCTATRVLRNYSGVHCYAGPSKLFWCALLRGSCELPPIGISLPHSPTFHGRYATNEDAVASAKPVSGSETPAPRKARLAVRLAMRLAAEFQTLYPFSARFAFAPGNELQDLREGEKQGETEPLALKKTAIESPETNKTWKNVTTMR
jgi:hypothetical protein